MGALQLLPSPSEIVMTPVGDTGAVYDAVNCTRIGLRCADGFGDAEMLSVIAYVPPTNVVVAGPLAA
jgi:predicted acyltransferase